MTALRSFLDWFDGFAENIDGAPNAKQWERITSRIALLREAAAIDPATDDAVEPAPKKKREPPRPTTQAQWKGAFTEAMLANGIDPETTRDLIKGREFDLSLDPVAVAREEAAKAMGGLQ